MRPNSADELKASIKATPQECYRWTASMPRRIDTVKHAQRGQAKYTDAVTQSKSPGQVLSIST